MAGLGRLRQEDGKFKASLDYITRPCLKKIFLIDKLDIIKIENH
jgi:hypothetical protein